MALRTSLRRVSRSEGRAEVSIRVVVQLSGVPRVGGRVIAGRVGGSLVVTKVSLTRLVRRLDLPTLSSPQMEMRTWWFVSVLISDCVWTERVAWARAHLWPLSIALRGSIIERSLGVVHHVLRHIPSDIVQRVHLETAPRKHD